MAGFGDIEAQIRQKMYSAMQVVNAKAKATMFEETGKFYSGGSPVLYPRTGGLGNSPRTSGVSGGGNVVSFEAYLEPPDYSGVNAYLQSMGYTSRFSGLEALTAAENHTDRVKGRPGFWARSENKFQRDLDSTMASFFG